MKSLVVIAALLSVNLLSAKQVLQDPKKILQDKIDYFVEKGGNLTEQELQDAKQKAQDIVQPDEARRLTLKIGMRVLEKSLLTESYDHQLSDQITPEDIAVALEGIEYVRSVLDNGVDLLSSVLTTTQNAQDFNTQLYHALAYLFTVILEVEKALEKIEFKVKANKTYEDVSAIFKFHIVPADLIQHLYTVNSTVYEKVPTT